RDRPALRRQPRARPPDRGQPEGEDARLPANRAGRRGRAARGGLTARPGWPPARRNGPTFAQGGAELMRHKKVALLLGPGFEDAEFRAPYDRLKEAGIQVDIIGARAGEELRGYKGRERVKADRAITEARVDEYDALVIPGGHSPD